MLKQRRLILAAVAAAALTFAAAALLMGGKTAPAVTFISIKGEKIATADLRGKVVLVNFWATWCEPCRDEMPSIQRLRDRLAGKPFVVLAVNLDEPESRIRNFLSKMPLDFPILVDQEKVATTAWKVRTLPTSFIIGRDGRIRYSLTGELAWDHDSVVNLLAELKEKLGLSYILISHDLSVVEHASDRVAVMYLGRIVETATVAAIFSSPKHPYTEALMSAVPGLGTGRPATRIVLKGDPPDPEAPPPGCPFHPRCHRALDRCGSEPPATANVGTAPAPHIVTCHLY